LILLYGQATFYAIKYKRLSDGQLPRLLYGVVARRSRAENGAGFANNALSALFAKPAIKDERRRREPARCWKSDPL